MWPTSLTLGECVLSGRAPCTSAHVLIGAGGQRSARVKCGTVGSLQGIKMIHDGDEPDGGGGQLGSSVEQCGPSRG